MSEKQETVMVIGDYIYKTHKDGSISVRSPDGKISTIPASKEPQ